MSRRRVQVGEYGQISYETRSDKVMARTRYRDLSGKLRRLSATGSSQTQARRALLKRLDDILDVHTGSGLQPDSPMSDLVDTWLKEVDNRDLTISSKRQYQTLARLYIRPYIGGWLIRDATVGRLSQVLTNHTERGLDHQALRKALHQLFDVAVRHGALHHNPIKSVSRIATRKEPPRVLHSSDELAEVMGLIKTWETEDRPGPSATPDVRELVILLAATGIRIGEALALRWQDIHLDVERPFLQVSGTIKQHKGKGIYRQDHPKSKSSRRFVELPPSVVALLRARKDRQEYNFIDAVFPSRVGTWQAHSGMYRRWRAIVKGTDYEWLTFTSFRSSVASLLSNEFGLDTAQNQLGHASQATTEAHYLARPQTAPQVAEFMQDFITEAIKSAEDA